MRLGNVWAVAKKDIAAVTRTRTLWVPMIIVPMLFFILAPLVMAAVPTHPGDVAKLLRGLPAHIIARLGDTTAPDFLLRMMLKQILAPLEILAPVVVASVMAADAFAGERERRTLEPLLHTPATDLEIFAGKVLAAWIPAVLTDLLGLCTLTAVVNAVAAHRVGFYLPDVSMILVATWLAPWAAGLSVAAMVFVSARVKGFQEATQMSFVVVLPVIAVMAAQTAGVLFLGPVAIIVMGAILLVIDVALVYFAAASFTRDRLFLRL